MESQRKLKKLIYFEKKRTYIMKNNTKYGILKLDQKFL